MLKRLVVILVPALLVVASAAAFAQGDPAVSTREDPTLGTFLTDPEGMTLYMFTRDRPNESACYDECAEAWPPFAATGDLSLPEGVPGTLGTTTRTDGSSQVTYNEMPLYYWAQDTQPGDTTGQGVGGVWFVVAPGADFGSYGVSAVASPVASPVAGTTVLVRRNQELGTFLIDADGMTLYLFTRDTTPGESACYDECAEAWPPFIAVEPLNLAPGIPGELGTITRTDGAEQVTYDGVPLYYYAEDAEPGDTTGQGVGDVWFVVPVGAGPATPTAG